MQPRGKYTLVRLSVNSDSKLMSVEKAFMRHRGTILAKGELVGSDIAIGDDVLFEDYGRINPPEDDTVAFVKDEAIVAKYINNEN